jgi:hypothetical protein
MVPRRNKTTSQNGASKENEPEIKSDFGEYPRFFELSHQILFQALEGFCQVPKHCERRGCRNDQRRARPRRRHRMKGPPKDLNVRHWHFGHGEVRVESVMRSIADIGWPRQSCRRHPIFFIHTRLTIIKPSSGNGQRLCFSLPALYHFASAS